MEAQKESAEKISGYSLHKTSTIFATVVIPIELIIGIVVYRYILGNPAHFMDNNPVNHPLPCRRKWMKHPKWRFLYWEKYNYTFNHCFHFNTYRTFGYSAWHDKGLCSPVIKYISVFQKYL